MEAEQILVVDDDPDILTILRDNLEWDGYTVLTASTGREALSLFRDKTPSLIILDLFLPDMDGIQVCRAIREESDVPIIMLTARDRVTDKVLGLETGADDYLVKPFEYLELAARIKACLRRRRPGPVAAEALIHENIKIDPARRVAFKDGKELNLTHTEFNLLFLLASKPGQAMSRDSIRKALWPEGDLYKGSRTIDVHIQHLRQKLEDDPHSPRYIKTIPSVGYLFEGTSE
ncbi:MAG: response regulator transcription factor [Thermodesulfobacteriota bacterium]